MNSNVAAHAGDRVKLKTRLRKNYYKVLLGGVVDSRREHAGLTLVSPADVVTVRCRRRFKAETMEMLENFDVVGDVVGDDFLEMKINN